MAANEQIKNLINKQKDLLFELEKETDRITSQKMVIENEELKQQLEKVRQQLDLAREELESIKEQRDAYKQKLFEKVYDEKMQALKQAAANLNSYYRKVLSAENQRINEFERQSRLKIEQLEQQLQNIGISQADELSLKIEQLKALAEERIRQIRADFASKAQSFSENAKEQLDEFAESQRKVSEADISSRKGLESFIGLNLINKLGILLIIIGVIAASRYTYLKLPDIFKSIEIFALGALMLMGGEFLNRRRLNVFSLGLTAGGTAILYVGVSASYFGLRIIGLYPAFALCILITAAAFILSKRYDSETIAAFALIGGYLPLFSVRDSLALLYCAMGYFVLLNLLALAFSFSKKWRVCGFIGLALNIISAFAVAFSVVPKVRGLDFGLPHVITLTYVLFAFLIYLCIPIASSYFKKISFNKLDTVLIAINTFFGSLIMYLLFSRFNLQDYKGVLSLFFAAVYFAAAAAVKKLLPQEKRTKVLLNIAGYVFAVLFVPYQLDTAWITLGWLVEGVLLTCYGILKQDAIFKKYGFIINCICAAMFIFHDVLWLSGTIFAYRYFSVTLASIVILGCYAFKNQLHASAQKAYKLVTLINLWFYLMYLCGKTYDLITPLLHGSNYSAGYLACSMAVVLTFLLAFLLLRSKILADKGVKVYSALLYVIGILMLFVINISMSPVQHSVIKEVPFQVELTATCVIALTALLSVLSLYDLLKMIANETGFRTHLIAVAVSAYFVLVLTQDMIIHFNISFSNFALSIIYAVTALLWIVYGFVKKNGFARRCGLALALASVAKMFIVDLLTLSFGLKIVSYFALGVCLVAISFVYQYFDKRLEQKEIK